MLGRFPASHRRRSNAFRLERLEDRVNPTTFTPSQIIHAYGFDQVAQVDGTTLTGAGQTIAIVDAFNDPDIKNDLTSFDNQFGIAAPPSFSVVSQTGSTTSLPQNSGGSNGWAVEISLDVEWSHAVAPGANILLVEATSSSMANLLAAVDYARNQAGVSVVSMSWGGGEASGESTHFTTPSTHVGGVSFVASAGDIGAEVIYPSSDPHVLSIGGTSLTLNNGNYGSESAWSDGGGGPSTIFAKPSFQTETVSGSMRGTPDVSYDADPGTGFYIYDTDGTSGLEGVGGTSAGAPQWAGLIALADQGRALFDQSTLDGGSQLLPAIYSLAATDFNDITTGSTSDGTTTYQATTGYDMATGLGSPKAQLVISGLIAYGSASGPVITTQPTSKTVTAGQTATFTAAATGNPAPTVQWQLSTDGGLTFNNISGATAVSFTTGATVAAINGYEYRAVFTNGVGSPATTNAATLTVDTPPTVTTQPASAEVGVGQTATFTAAATGNPAPTVQWQISTTFGIVFNNISGATSTTYTTPVTVAANSGYEYRAVFTNGVGTPTDTNAAILTVDTAPTVTTEPAPQSVTVGQTATFTAAATGSPTPTVQWQDSVNGNPFADIPGATSTTYAFNPALTDNGTVFRAVFTNAGGNANTFGVPVTVVAPVTVAGIQVGDGTAQRSEVDSLTVTFSGPVTFANGDVAAAFQLNHVQTGNNVTLAANATPNSLGQTVVTLTFSGSETDPVSTQNGGAASLADGRYTLTITSAAVTDANGAALDGAGTGTAGSGNYVSPTDTLGGGAGELGLYRLFGDTNGDGVVDQLDLGQFRSSFNATVGNPLYLSYLDADNSGSVDQVDLGQFRTRFNTNIF